MSKRNNQKIQKIDLETNEKMLKIMLGYFLKTKINDVRFGYIKADSNNKKFLLLEKKGELQTEKKDIKNLIIFDPFSEEIKEESSVVFLENEDQQIPQEILVNVS